MIYSTVSSLIPKPSNIQVPTVLVQPTKPVDPQKEFHDLCVANLQHPRDVEDKSVVARQSSKSMVLNTFLKNIMLLIYLLKSAYCKKIIFFKNCHIFLNFDKS